MPELLEEQRENWGSRAGFVLAAIGSAVGLGNLWGFPYKVYDNGGGAFLIPYLIAMVLIGIPLLILEFSLGHMTQRAAPDAYRGINRKTEPVGWWGILLGFVIITYYPVILAYCGSFLIECVKGVFANGGEVPWKAEGIEGVGRHFNDYLQSWAPGDLEGGTAPWAMGKLVGPVVVSLAVMWALMYLCIFRGVKLVSKVVLLTVPLPWIMLGILTVRGLTLDGASEGLNFYLAPNWSELAKPETWRWAFGQMFFSMSLAFGVMITYASFLHRKSDINNNAAIIGLADIGTSFVAGIAVFATLGAMAFATRAAGNAVSVTKVVTGGPGLVFVAFPYALAQLPASAWFGVVFFIALLTLGIDSAFSITESVLASLVDKTGWNRDRTLIGMTVVGFVLGLIYCTRGGLNWLGAIDSFINDPWGGIALLGLLECVVIGWAYRLKRLREHANERSDWRLGWWWDVVIRYVAPLLLSALFTWSVLEKAASPGGFLWDAEGVFQTPALVAMIVALLVPLLALLLSAVRSPGADTHAQHLGQERAGRDAGVLGSLLAAAALVLLAWSFWLCREAVQAVRAGNDIAAVMPVYDVWGIRLPLASLIALASAGVGLLATIIGAGVVAFAEGTHHRPSGFARLSAGAGVMEIGGAGGLVLSMFVLLMGKTQAAPPQPPAEPPTSLLPWAWIVLAGMTAILVVGLGWCFYRAVKAAGAEKAAEQQPAEDLETAEELQRDRDARSISR